GSSVSTSVRVAAYGQHTFTCKILCAHDRTLVCGIEIDCGNPPEAPRNLACIQHGAEGHPTCTWDRGRPTHIPTTYAIQ
ncbi:I12R2 protein, partial [Upupa epops]|nr:I12R2 protein [Upupa epops]